MTRRARARATCVVAVLSSAYCAHRVEVSDSSANVLPPGCDYASRKIDRSKTYDLCVVGAGLSGTVFAERTAKLLGERVLVFDSRPHIGGERFRLGISPNVAPNVHPT
jgi:NADPH-dependent 2,4-dienoyl-CoA reductase/sulfur reductase-like enzyme